MLRYLNRQKVKFLVNFHFRKNVIVSRKYFPRVDIIQIKFTLFSSMYRSSLYICLSKKEESFK